MEQSKGNDRLSRLGGSSWLRAGAAACACLLVALVALERRGRPKLEETAASPESAGMEAPGLSAPAAPSAAGVPRAESRAYTNELLHSMQEEEKRRMGIVKILPRSREPEASEGERPADAANPAMEERRDFMRRMAAEFAKAAASRKPQPVALSGAKPRLLVRERGALAAAGGPVGTAARGYVVRSAQELDNLWKSRVLPPPPLPTIDFSKRMLLAVFPDFQNQSLIITNVKEEQGQIIVQYKETTSGPAFDHYVLTKSELPVNFQREP